MKFIYIILLFHVVLTTYADDENETKDTVGVEAEVKSASPDDVEHVEPEMAVRDALTESELVKSSNPGDGYLSSDLRSDGADAATPVDDSERSADIISAPDDGDTTRSADDSQRSIVPGVKTVINSEEGAVRSADDPKFSESLSPGINDESLRTAKEDESVVTADVVSVRSATPEDLTLSTTRMNDNVLDTKARSGNVIAPMPQAQTLKPLDFPALGQLNSNFLPRPDFKPFPPLPPLNLPNPPLPTIPPFPTNPFDTKPLLPDNIDLTNQYKRFNNYPAMERFQSYPLSVPLSSTFAPIEKSLNNLLLKANEVPPLLFNQNIPPRPFFAAGFGNPVVNPNYFLPNFNNPRINT